MIRRATLDDLAEVVRLAVEFHAYSPYRDMPVDMEAFPAFAERLIEGGAVFLSDDGVIGGLLNPLYFNPAVVFAVELFWFARSEGQELRAAFEAWGRESGAVGCQSTGLHDDHAKAITRIYRRAGYEPVEIAFMKRF